MDDLLHFSPNPVTFECTPARQTTAHLNLRNVSEHPVAYKVKTNNVERYSVRPSAAIIQPNAQMDVELTQQALKKIPDDVTDCGDRFLLQFARVDLVPIGKGVGQLHGYESALALWKAIPNEVIQKAKFGVLLKTANVPSQMQMEQEHLLDTDVKPRSIMTAHAYADNRCDTSDNALEKPIFSQAVSTTVPEAVTETQVDSETVSMAHQQSQQTPQSSSSLEAAVPSMTVGPGVDGSEFLSPQAEDSKNQKDGSEIKESSNEAQNEIDYASIEYARERARGIRTAPKISLLSPDEATKQRVAAERAGELIRTIQARGKEIDSVNGDLSEARHRLHDAMAATAPAYDVKYEVSESSRVPYAQIAIMAIISGAILQLLV